MFDGDWPIYDTGRRTEITVYEAEPDSGSPLVDHRGQPVSFQRREPYGFALGPLSCS